MNIFYALLFGLLLTQFVIRLLNRYACCNIRNANFGIFLLFLILLFLLLYVPIYSGNTGAQLLHGILGELSMTTLLVFPYWFCQKEFENNTLLNRGRFSFFIVLLSLLLYFSTLGFLPFEIYSQGYFPTPLFMLFFCLFVLYFVIRAPIYAGILVLVLISFYFQIGLSNNIFDYLTDVVLFSFACVNLYQMKK